MCWGRDASALDLTGRLSGFFFLPLLGGEPPQRVLLQIDEPDNFGQRGLDTLHLQVHFLRHPPMGRVARLRGRRKPWTSSNGQRKRSAIPSGASPFFLDMG